LAEDNLTVCPRCAIEKRQLYAVRWLLIPKTKGSVVMKDSNQCSRSDFFKGAGVVAGAAALSAGEAQAADPKPNPSGPELRRLGKTDLKIPVISLGTGPGQDVNVMKFAVAQGMNFIHTSVGYKKGRAISNLAEAIKGQRDKVILGLKITWQPDDDDAMDAALEKLGVDSVDIAFFNIHKADKVKDPEYRKAAERWIKAGKFKYIGLTSHKETSQCVKNALDEGFYNAIMPSYTMSMEDEFMPIFERAEKGGIGVILMKTHRGLTGAYEEAIPHYLALPGVTTINRGAESFPQVKQFIEASKQKADKQAGIRLRERAKIAMVGHCTMCGACTQSCPKGIEVADVVRCSDYYLENAEYIETAYETYRELSLAPSLAVCGSCNLCEQACPYSVPVAHHLRRAETTLA
jgi:predicted aldo/keto reductase-like oxidoreductase